MDIMEKNIVPIAENARRLQMMPAGRMPPILAIKLMDGLEKVIWITTLPIRFVKRVKEAIVFITYDDLDIS